MGSMQDTFAIFLGKMLASAIVTALVSVAAIYFVVDMSLRGTETAIETTNKRIDDLRNELVSRIDLKFEALEMQLKNEFSQTRKEIKKAEIETGVKVAGALPGWRPIDYQGIQLFLDPKGASLAQISMADPVFASWANNPANASELSRIESSGLIIQPFRSAIDTQVRWEANSKDADGFLTALMKFKDCTKISQALDGSALVVPIAEKTIVGRDGIFCKPAAE